MGAIIIRIPILLFSGHHAHGVNASAVGARPKMDLSFPGIEISSSQPDFWGDSADKSGSSTSQFAIAGAPDDLDTWDEVGVRRWESKKPPCTTTRPNDAGKLYKAIVEPSEIRVLQLKPGAAGDALQASLHHCSVEFESPEEINDVTGISYTPNTQYALSMSPPRRPVTYTALSYTWGPPVFEAEVECDGHVRAITRSLEAALRHFRRTDRSVFMWIDQICINQQDHREKEQQIPLMSQIYRHALNTTIWLGVGSPGSDAALRFLDHIGHSLQYVHSTIAPADFERALLPAEHSQVWKEVWLLMSSPWFARLWIIQEVILSTQPWVFAGHTFISWEAFTGACNQLVSCGISSWLNGKFAPKSDQPSDQHHATCESVLNLNDVRSHYRSFIQHQSLFGLLVRIRDAQCYDLRDKIYGLLGVCADEARKSVRVSYADDCTAADLYRDVTASYFQGDASGWALSMVLTCVDHDSPGMPSWVPDWSKPRQTASLGYSTSSRNTYNACGRLKPVPRQCPHSINENNEKELCVRGIVCDSIVTISDVFIDPDLTYVNPAVENNALIHAANFVSTVPEPLSSGTLFEAFCQTMVAGRDGTGLVKSPSSYTEILSLLLDESTGQSPSLSGQTYSARQKRPQGKGRLDLDSLSQRTAGQTFQDMRVAMKTALRNRRLGVTAGGRLGLLPQKCDKGDEVVVLHGSHVPFLVRRAGQDRFRVVGECFVHGIMDGEAVDRGGDPLKDYILC